jgi:serine/threonine protein kinase
LDQVIQKHRQADTRIELGKVKKWSIEILKGLDYLHGKRLLHLDIKPANVFLDELDRVKVGDLAHFLWINVGAVGGRDSLFYASPEMIAGEVLNEKTDIWYESCLKHSLLPSELSNLSPFKGRLDASLMKCWS